MKRLVLSYILLFVIYNTSYSQIDWNWSPDKDYHTSVVRVENNGGRGTGVIIEEEGVNYCITACHVVIDDINSIIIRFCDGSMNNNCVLLGTNSECDIAIISVSNIPETLTVCKLAKKNILVNDKIEIMGLGGATNKFAQNNIRHFFTIASVTTNEKTIFADTALLSGDSGGPVLNVNAEVVTSLDPTEIVREYPAGPAPRSSAT